MRVHEGIYYAFKTFWRVGEAEYHLHFYGSTVNEIWSILISNTTLNNLLHFSLFFLQSVGESHVGFDIERAKNRELSL